MRKRILAIAVVLATCGCGVTSTPMPGSSASASTVDRPREDLTPGAYNPNVTQATIQTTICVPGWTKTVRPSIAYTDALKAKQIREYGYWDTKLSDYEEDHLVPLELGGAPTDPKNLWPEPHSSSFIKDREENDLHAAVCSGRMTLDQARSTILTNWGPR